MLEMGGAAKTAVEMCHAEGEVAGCGEAVDGGVGEGGIGAKRRVGGGCVGSGEVLGEVG